ncbi:MAG: ferritin-like domain-containing protein [Chloroflexota bacterium]
MLISERLAQAMNEQIGRELGASNQYLTLAAHFDGRALPQLATFFYRQADQERMHAEEVSTMGALLRVVRRAGDSGLLLVEEYLARRGDPHAGEEGT